MKKLIIALLIVLGLTTFAHSGSYKEYEFQSVYQVPRNDKVGFKNQMTLPLTYGDQYLNISRQGGVMLCKVYIPPGTSAISAFAYVTQGTGYVSVAIARFRIPPTIDSSWPASKDDLAGIPNEPGRVIDATGKDYICRSSGGYLDIINDYGIRVNTDGEAGWLYLIMKTFSPQSIISTAITEIVRSSIYLPWLNAKTDWLPNGDPAAPGQPVPTSTPIPTPVPTQPPPTPPAGAHSFNFGELGYWSWDGTTLRKQ